MGPTDEQISETLQRLARAEFDVTADWPVCYELVRSEILRRRLPAKVFGPSSQFGGSDWTVDDFTELASEWIIFVRGKRAQRLMPQGRSAVHVANGVRVSIRNFVLDQCRQSPQSDLWAALKEIIAEYPTLRTGAPCASPAPPDQPFPWQRETARTSSRQRVVTAPEVRAALAIVQQRQPEGWTFDGLFNYLAAWSGVEKAGEQSLDAMNSFHEPIIKTYLGGAESAVLGRKTARMLLGQLDERERAILRGFIIPNGLGKIGLEEAARTLGMAKSTLDERARRLKTKLASIEFDDVVTRDSEARRAFFSEILEDDAGKTAGDESNK